MYPSHNIIPQVPHTSSFDKAITSPSPGAVSTKHTHTTYTHTQTHTHTHTHTYTHTTHTHHTHRHTHIHTYTHTLTRSEEHTSELQSHLNLVCRLLLEKKKPHTTDTPPVTTHMII